MADTNFHVFGLGLGADDLRYIGWTQKSVEAEQEQILTEVVNGRTNIDLATWVDEAKQSGQLSLFEIEEAPSKEAAQNSATSLCTYFRSLGLDVTTGH
jgi:hypothetical protein